MKTSIYTEKYSPAIADQYYRDVRALIYKYYKNVSEQAVEAFLSTGDFAMLTATELLARSGITEVQLNKRINDITTRFTLDVENQINGDLRAAYAVIKRPIPKEVIYTGYSKASKNLISQQTQKIKGLLDYQYTKINEAVQLVITENKGVSYLKKQLNEAGIYREKRIKLITHNQLNYATNIININKADELGLEDATWRHPPKSFYKTHGRPSHIKADGKRFKLSRGCKIDGEFIYPGQLPNCKCFYQLEIKGM